MPCPALHLRAPQLVSPRCILSVAACLKKRKKRWRLFCVTAPTPLSQSPLLPLLPLTPSPASRLPTRLASCPLPRRALVPEVAAGDRHHPHQLLVVSAACTFASLLAPLPAQWTCGPPAGVQGGPHVPSARPPRHPRRPQPPHRASFALRPPLSSIRPPTRTHPFSPLRSSSPPLLLSPSNSPPQLRALARVWRADGGRAHAADQPLALRRLLPQVSQALRYAAGGLGEG